MGISFLGLFAIHQAMIILSLFPDSQNIFCDLDTQMGLATNEPFYKLFPVGL